MKRGLVLTSMGFIILFALLTPLLPFRYLLSAGPIFEVVTLLNMLGRPLVGLLIAVVLIARFRDVWARRVDISELAEDRMARFSQTTGLVLMGFFYVAFVVVLAFQLIPTEPGSAIPVMFIVGPLLTSLPAGYFLFELGRLIDKDRQEKRI